MQQLQDPNHSNVDNLNSAVLEASENFSNIHVFLISNFRHVQYVVCCMFSSPTTQ
jgi:hypothetical protein